ncbi:hypothetical protein BLNAU_1925 [Blattamonas nauphoetae]|uniref:Uncharacterized protein n=1 Tax=Blattamonas nauphoetae TaxID=2049346 RepID=A0ABQ9YGL8_9EUKA|nr:hypothetical protein BLNAU_1925 [Blattamonas nauphoetae]
MLKNREETKNDEVVESEHLDDEDPDAAGPENEQAESEHEDLQEKDDGKAEDVDDYEEDKVKSKKSKVMSKQAQHHSETNDNDDEIVKKSILGRQEVEKKDRCVKQPPPRDPRPHAPLSQHLPRTLQNLLRATLLFSSTPLLSTPKHETVLVDTSVPLFDDSIFFNADFSSRLLSRRRPSSQSFFVDHGYSISDHLVSKRHLLPLPFCGEEGVGLAQTIISSVVSAFSTTSDSRHENSFGPSSTFSFTPISQNIYNRTDNPASLFIPPSPTPQQAASAPSPLSTLLNLCPHEMFTLTSDDLPMVDHLLRKGFTQFNPPASGSPNAALNRDETLGTTLLSLVALSLPFELSEENDTLILQHGHMLSPSVVTFHHSNSPNHNRPYEGVYTHTQVLSRPYSASSASLISILIRTRSKPTTHRLAGICGHSSHPDSPASAPSSPPSTSQVICHPAAPHQTICLLLSLLIRSRRKERRKRQQAFSPSISLHCDRAYHPADPTPHLDPLRSLDTLQQKLQTLFSTHRPASCVDRDSLDAEQRTETEAEGDVERGWTGKTLSSPQSQISSFVGEINSDFTSM